MTMKTISLKLDESIFEDTEKILEKIKKPRNRYINEALRYYNRLHKRELLAKRFAYESNLVRAESMKVMEDFDHLEYGD